jgi:hypothetical protein
MNTPDRAALLEHLQSAGIAGRVATPRENNLLHYRLLADRDPYYLLGLDPSAGWTGEAVLGLMAERIGVNPDPGYRAGVDTIDPELTLVALDRYGDRLAEAALRRESVWFATGHPASLAQLYQRFADALRARGCRILRLGEGWGYDATTRYGQRRLTIGYSAAYSTHSPTPTGGDVAALGDAGGPVHSHAARPLRATFAALSWPTTAGAAGPRRPARTRSASPTATTPRSSWANTRAWSGWPCRSTTASSRRCTNRWATTCSPGWPRPFPR